MNELCTNESTGTHDWKLWQSLNQGESKSYLVFDIYVILQDNQNTALIFLAVNFAALYKRNYVWLTHYIERMESTYAT